MLYREEFELERLRWRLRPGDLDLDRRRTGDLRLGDRDLTEKEEKAFIRRQEQQVPVICQLIYQLFKDTSPPPSKKPSHTTVKELQRNTASSREEKGNSNSDYTAGIFWQRSFYFRKLKECVISKEQTRILSSSSSKISSSSFYIRFSLT